MQSLKNQNHEEQNVDLDKLIKMSESKPAVHNKPIHIPCVSNSLQTNASDEFDVIPDPKDSGVSSSRGGSDSPSLGSAKTTANNTPVHVAASATLPNMGGQLWAMTSGPVENRTAPLEELKLNLDDILDSSETYAV